MFVYVINIDNMNIYMCVYKKIDMILYYYKYGISYKKKGSVG